MLSDAEEFIEKFSQSIIQNSFIKLTLSEYRGQQTELKNIYVKKIVAKRQEKLSFLYRYKTKDSTKNYPPAEALAELAVLLGENAFWSAHLFTTNATTKLHFFKGTFILKTEKPSSTELPSVTHDNVKNRKIAAAGKPYLYELGITDAQGNVYKQAQDKYRQINHYIEILSTLLQALPPRPLTTIVDMGAGKGYLTFALYDYLTNVIGKPAQITGVEFRRDLVELCGTISRNAGFTGLSFVEGTIESYQPDAELNVLIALHACDTATDEAIFKGITNNADLIVVAPCCHKQIRREIEKNKAANELDFLIRHGIFLERQAEMITDGLRSLILESHGYATKVFEFISDAHTPKNVLIVAEKRRNGTVNKETILAKIREAKRYFGIETHHLEALLAEHPSFSI